MNSTEKLLPPDHVHFLLRLVYSARTECEEINSIIINERLSKLVNHVNTGIPT